MLEKMGIDLQSVMELKQALFELADGEETLELSKARDVISLGFVGVLRSKLANEFEQVIISTCSATQ